MRWVKWITLGIMGWYMFLCTVHFFNQRPLWNDEACVFNSIRELSPGQLFAQPLLSVQQFPRVYIYLIQQISTHFDFSYLSLRFLPFVFMLGAFLVWMRIGVLALSSALERLMFALCWTASIPLIYYAAELKQYSMDVFAASLFILFCLNQFKIQAGNPVLYRFLLFCLPFLALFGYTVPLMFIFVWVNIVRKEGFNSSFMIFTASTAAVISFIYWFDLRIGNGAALHDYWKDYFISFHSLGDFLRTAFEGTNNLISRWFVESPRWIRGAARFFLIFGLWQMVAGFKRQVTRDNYLFSSVSTIAFIVYIELFLLGAFQVYAFSVPRTSLFFAPMVLMLSIIGFKRLSMLHQRAYYLMCGIFIVFLVYVSWGISREILSGDLGAQTKIWNAR